MYSGDVNIRHDVLYEHCALGLTNKTSEVYGVHGGLAANIEVAYGSVLCIGEESAVVEVHLIAVFDCVSLTVKDTAERCILVAYHKAWEITLGKVNVSGQHGIGSNLTTIH